jgi:hypothetical protein
MQVDTMGQSRDYKIVSIARKQQLTIFGNLPQDVFQMFYTLFTDFQLLFCWITFRSLCKSRHYLQVMFSPLWVSVDSLLPTFISLFSSIQGDMEEVNILPISRLIRLSHGSCYSLYENHVYEQLHDVWSRTINLKGDLKKKLENSLSKNEGKWGKSIRSPS